MKIVQQLREFADQLETTSGLSGPLEGTELQRIGEAFARIRLLVGKHEYISISRPDFDWHGGGGPIKSGEWSIYVAGQTHYKGKTLEAVLAAVIEANTEQPPLPDESAVNAIALSNVSEALVIANGV